MMTLSGCMTTPTVIKPRIPIDALTECEPLSKAGDLKKPIRVSDLALLNIKNIEIHKNCMAKQQAFADAIGVELIGKDKK